MSQKAEVKKGLEAKRAASIIGGVAFAAAFVLAVIGGAAARDNAGLVLALTIIGIVVALLNISAKEVLPVLVTAIALIVAGQSQLFGPLDDIADGFGRLLNSIVGYLAVFMVPVAVISAVRAVIVLARPGD